MYKRTRYNNRDSDKDSSQNRYRYNNRYHNRYDRYDDGRRSYQTNQYHNNEKLVTRILPDFKPSGLLELDSNNIEGVHILHVDPSDSTSPEIYYSKYPTSSEKIFKISIFKNTADSMKSKDNVSEKPIEEIELYDQKHYLIGRDKIEVENEDTVKGKDIVVADILLKDEKLAKQQCVLQFREINGELKLYLMDLNCSKIDTLINDMVIPKSRYVELISGDVIVLNKFEIVYVCN
ncbi:hypothetical protein TBLA_0D03390 [Henningerozyma blattae CBS 6284]|uniref:FHA domain-containing protein n=1 Tax=Henningerozyma blattae (strain ATCC 34711 / CBS 6284 / DSM 70876 / NBRC 10599 / NRRL Y-10934 / UCD 77-7) TaxID=1071380 RepID=I2H387_HENB6|nr:hypothetical protein TBLA_0D03390 [Tetrapisispora blattae CBS 6284]CCH60839.1 hypothetical protein TBLA_0D03390 [Tetrapisispora blattae CBS 6284]